jgi:hypothetical protein
MVLTETHLRAREKKKGWFKETLRGYTTWAACYTSEARQPGVIVAIKEHLAVLGRATSHTTHALDGRLVHVTLKLPHSAPLAISGVYAPADTTQEAMKSGTNSTSILLNTQKETRSRWGHRQPPCGRLNAGLCEGDRKAHHKTPSTHCLYNRKDLCTWKQRRPTGTHIPTAAGGTAETVSSRIDDILMSKTLQGTSRGPQGGHPPTTRRY